MQHRCTKLKSNFNGLELESRLAGLTRIFEEELRHVAEQVHSAIVTAAWYRGQEGVEDVLYEFFGIRPSLGDGFSFDSASSLADTVKDFILQMGLKVRQFMLEHGSTLNFITHVMNNTNTFDSISSLFSPEDLASIKTW